MINSQRKKEIIEYLSDTDYRTLKDIADKFAISMNTARRDINELAEENLVKKFYGGVSLARKKDSIYVITKVIEVVNWDLIVVGSRLKHSSCSLINVYDWDYLNSLNVNKAFLATTGLTIQGGATNPDNAETIIKTSMMKRSQENFLLTDSSKFDRTSLRTFANIEDFDKIITSGSVPKHFVEYCAAGSTQLIIA